MVSGAVPRFWMSGPRSGVAGYLPVMSLTTSWMALSCSVICQHICDVWLGRPQDWHVLPNAGHWVLLMAVLALVPWPWWPQKQHAVLVFRCGVGMVKGRLGVADRLGWGGHGFGWWVLLLALIPTVQCLPLVCLIIDGAVASLGWDGHCGK